MPTDDANATTAKAVLIFALVFLISGSAFGQSQCSDPNVSEAYEHYQAVRRYLSSLSPDADPLLVFLADRSVSELVRGQLSQRDRDRLYGLAWQSTEDSLDRMRAIRTWEEELPAHEGEFTVLWRIHLAMNSLVSALGEFGRFASLIADRTIPVSEIVDRQNELEISNALETARIWLHMAELGCRLDGAAAE